MTEPGSLPPVAASRNWQRRYARYFVMAMLGAALIVMLISLRGGLSQFQNNFLGRRELISAFNQLRLGMGDRVFAQVLVGKDGWLHFTVKVNIDDYQNVYDASDDDVLIVHRKLEALAARFEEQGKTLIVVISPNKATIYPETMPDEIQKLGEQSRFDHFLSYFEAEASPIILDLRPALQQARLEREIYYKTDSHWNDYGAYAVYQAMMLKLAESFPSLTPRPLSEFKIISRLDSPLDLSNLLGATRLIEPRTVVTAETNAQHRTVVDLSDARVTTQLSWGPDQSLPKLVMYHDSFGYPLLAFLYSHFSSAAFVAEYFKPDMDASWIDQIDADIVIIEIAEREFTVLKDWLPDD